MYLIAIIGAGQIGSRHLQALAFSTLDLNIQVVDTSEESLKIAKERFEQVNQNFNGEIAYLNAVSQLPDKIDLTIVATNSRVRKDVVEELLTTKKTGYLLLEKFLFTKPQHYKEIEDLLENSSIKCWVNCGRRMFPFYSELKEKLHGKIHFSVSGNSWGLGSSTIHFLDLFAYLTGTNEMILNNDLLDNKVIVSKKKGFVEFTGTLRGYTKDLHSFQAISYPVESSPFFIIVTIHSESANYIIVEEIQTAMVRYCSVGSKWKWKETVFNIPFQSQLSHLLVEDILKTGNCNLTPYDESSKLHLLILKNFIDFQNSINSKNIEECLIT